MLPHFKSSSSVVVVTVVVVRDVVLRQKVAVRGSREKVGRWTRAEGWGLGRGLPSSCNLVHFWRPVQQKMYHSAFNLDFGRSV